MLQARSDVLDIRDCAITGVIMHMHSSVTVARIITSVCMLNNDWDVHETITTVSQSDDIVNKSVVSVPGEMLDIACSQQMPILMYKNAQTVLRVSTRKSSQTH